MGILDGKVVLVTGGGNGIGRDCALIAAQEGREGRWSTISAAAWPAATKARPARPRRWPRKSAPRAARRPPTPKASPRCEPVKGMVQQALDTFGGLHAVINPAGILRDGMFHKMSEADWDKVIEVHLKGSFNVARATIEHFRDQNDGAYVFFTSTSGLLGNIGQTNYGAAKMGIAGLSRIIAMEGARNNVRANCPGPRGLDPDDPVGAGEGRSRRRAPCSRWPQAIRPDQPARFSVALVSEAAKNVSGQIFGASGENIILYSQPRPIETLTKPEGWTIDDDPLGGASRRWARSSTRSPARSRACRKPPSRRRRARASHRTTRRLGAAGSAPRPTNVHPALRLERH